MNADLTFENLREMMLYAMNGKVDVTEKIDGINYRFKVTEVVHSLGGGKFYSLSEYSERGVFDSNILDVMEGMYNGVYGYLQKHYAGCMIECELILPSSPNVVMYAFKKPTIVIRKIVDLTTGNEFPVGDFIDNFDSLAVDVIEPPTIVFRSRSTLPEEQEYTKIVSYADSVISRCLHRHSLTATSTIGDYLYACALRVVRKEFGYSLSNRTEDLLCRRWALNDKTTRLSGKSVGNGYLRKVKEMDKVARKLQDEWFFELYVMIARVGNYIISRYDGYLNDVSDVSLDDMIMRINSLIVDTQGNYKKAFATRVISNSGMDSLSKCTEGVVFNFRESSYKFVGNFTWINQLVWSNK